jgi:protein-tyrosine phosphatase
MFDLHCHVLPGIDDGAIDLDDSISMCRASEADGVNAIVATPHFIDGELNTNVEDILGKTNLLNRELEKQNISLKVLPGMEIYISPNLDKLYEDGKILTLNNKGYMLIELPLIDVFPTYISDVLFRLQIGGIIPIIAHVERYIPIQKSPNRAYSLIEKGCLLQVNAGSLDGKFGEKAKETAEILIEHSMVHFISSDNHSMSKRYTSLKKSYDYFSKNYGKVMANNLFIRNTQAVIEGEDIEYQEPERVEKKKKRSIFGFFK